MISAWGTGKDLSALARVLDLAQYPDNLIVVFRQEYRDLKDSTIFDFESYTGLKVNCDGDCIVTTSDPERPSKIMFRHIEQLNSLQNLNLGAFWINQAEELSGPEAFYLLMGRLRRNVPFRSGFLTANANGHNWVYNIWLSERSAENEIGMKGHKDYPCWQATTYDNADVLPRDYVDSLKSLPESIYKRFVLNDHSVAEGLIWPEFNEELHTCDSFYVPDEWKDSLALDHGHDHPTAVVFGAVDWDGTLLIYNEHFEAGALISHHANAIKIKEPYYQHMLRMIDPTCRFKNMQDGTRCYSVMEAYADNGITFRPSPMDAMASINKVGELFKKNKIKIFRDRCPNLVRQIKNWKWKRAKVGQERMKVEEPIRIDEDACKALTYLVAGRLEAPERAKKDPRGFTESSYEHTVSSRQSFAQNAYGVQHDG